MFIIATNGKGKCSVFKESQGKVKEKSGKSQGKSEKSKGKVREFCLLNLVQTLLFNDGLKICSPI